ncbi:hypothetical protein ACONYW_001973 [Escherichia coli]
MLADAKDAAIIYVSGRTRRVAAQDHGELRIGRRLRGRQLDGRGPAREPARGSGIAILGGAAALQVARDASKVLIRLLVIGPAWCVLFLVLSPYFLDGSNPAKDAAQRAVEWGEAFRSVPAGEVPTWDCPKATSLDGSPLPPPVTRDACAVASKPAATWIDETAQGAGQVYLFFVTISGLVLVGWRVFRASMPNIGKTILGLFQRRVP